jgi:tetratricopeptide (TPR) repeat protein
MTTGRPSAGVEHFREALLAFPDYGRAHYALALALRDLGQAAPAQQELALSQTHRYGAPVLDDPLLREVALLNVAASDQLLYGIVLETKGQLEPSIAAHERALQMNPSLVQAHINLISLYGRKGDLARAEAHYRAAVAANPELADSHFNYGLVLQGAGRSAEAAEEFRLSLEGNPWNPEAHFNYAQIIERDGRLLEAVAHYREALDNAPGHRLARFHLGRILVYQDRLPEGLVHLRQTLLPEDENTPRFTYALGATLARDGQTEEALRYLREAWGKANARGQTDLAERIARDIKTLEP